VATVTGPIKRAVLGSGSVYANGQEIRSRRERHDDDE
jgi:hypothetical protein